MKKLLLTVSMLFSAAVLAVSADAAVSSPCTAKPRAEAPRPRQVVEQTYRRDVLGSKVPLATHKEGDALTDTATKYEETLISGQE